MIIVPLALIVGVLWLIVYFTDNFEGVASIGLLAVAIAGLWFGGRETVENKYTIIVFFVIFGFLGIMFDRAGNFIYNKPFQMLCPAETVLDREVIVEEDYEGNTQHNHYFSCYSMTQGKSIKHFPIYQTVGIRFVQYIVLGFILLGFYWLISRLFASKK
jgi:hypothetical protein